MLVNPKLTENDLLDAHFSGVRYGRELQKEETKAAHLAGLRSKKKPVPVPKVQVAESPLAMLNSFDFDKNIGHFETENALAGLTTAIKIEGRNKGGWRLERVSGTTKLTYKMPDKINSHAVTTLLKLLQMYKESGNLNGELVTSYTELAKSGKNKPCHKSQIAIYDDLEALASATIAGEEVKAGNNITWAGEKAFLSYVAVNDGIKIKLAPRLIKSIEENWSFARIDLNLRNELSSVGQNLHLYLSAWVRGGTKQTELDKLIKHVFREGEGGDIYWQRNRIKKALTEIASKNSFKYLLEKQGKETMISVWP